MKSVVWAFAYVPVFAAYLIAIGVAARRSSDLGEVIVVGGIVLFVFLVASLYAFFYDAEPS